MILEIMGKKGKHFRHHYYSEIKEYGFPEFPLELASKTDQTGLINKELTNTVE